MTIADLRALIANAKDTDVVVLMWQKKDFEVEAASDQPATGVRLILSAEKQREF